VDRMNLFRSWSSLGSLVPKGGNAIWGDALHGAPDDLYAPDYNDDSTVRFGHFLEFVGPNSPENKTVEQAMEFLFQQLNTSHSNISSNLQKWFSLGMARTARDMKQQSKHWSNPLESQLPDAPDMTVYCLYGVGKATERGYTYYDQTEAPGSFPLPGIKYAIATSAAKNGVRFTEGDGTVPLVSLGYMCVDAWKRKLFNPSGITVYAREYLHKPWSPIKDPRGGPETADHVDILGNLELLEDILAIVTGEKNSNKDRIYSEIVKIAKEISRRAELNENVTYPEQEDSTLNTFMKFGST